LISCDENKNISEIKDYVKEVENRSDLNESITEFITENLTEENIGGTSIYELTDNKNKLYRIITQTSLPNDSITNFEFYYKNEKLIFAKVLQFSNNWSKLDTIRNSELFFHNNQLIKQVNINPKGINSDYIKSLAESFTIKGLGTE